MDKQYLYDEINKETMGRFGLWADNADAVQLHEAVSSVVMREISPRWNASRRKHLSGRRACYLSMEFLMGRAVFRSLLRLFRFRPCAGRGHRAGRGISWHRHLR